MTHLLKAVRRGLGHAFLAWLAFGGPSVSQAEDATIKVAAASSLKYAMETLIASYQKVAPDTRVQLITGSSGNFFGQIVNRAPFDAFFSADMDYPRRLAEQGLCSAPAPFVYASGDLVLWVRENAYALAKTEGLAMLARAEVRQVAIANPRLAPYGRAAQQALARVGQDKAVTPKLVLGENVAQAAQMVQSGAADAGIIARSLVYAPDAARTGRYVPIPRGLHDPIEQGGCVLRHSKAPLAARRFVDFVLSPAGQRVLADSGFNPTRPAR